MKRLFVDTFYLIALFEPHDDAHQHAVDASHEPFRVVTTRWILAEFADGFAADADREDVARFIDAVVNHPHNIVTPATNEWFDRGLILYRGRPDKEWSLTDCISFLVMEDIGIREALTGDHHFEQAGFVALLK